MLSTVIYETADFIYTIGRLTIRTVKNAYSWFYKKDNNALQLQIKSLEARVAELENTRLRVKTF